MADSNDKRVIGRYERVTLIGKHGQVDVDAKADTGADRSNIDRTVLEEIGATNISDTVETRAGSDSGSRDVVSIAVELPSINDGKRTVEPNVKDRSNYTGDFLIGADLLNELNLLVDVSVDNTDS